MMAWSIQEKEWVSLLRISSRKLSRYFNKFGENFQHVFTFSYGFMCKCDWYREWTELTACKMRKQLCRKPLPLLKKILIYLSQTSTHPQPLPVQKGSKSLVPIDRSTSFSFCLKFLPFPKLRINTWLFKACGRGGRTWYFMLPSSCSSFPFLPHPFFNFDSPTSKEEVEGRVGKLNEWVKMKMLSFG